MIKTASNGVNRLLLSLTVCFRSLGQQAKNLAYKKQVVIFGTPHIKTFATLHRFIIFNSETVGAALISIEVK